jgi:hypothetical protein
MAYQVRGNSQMSPVSKPATSVAASGSTSTRKSLFQTGLFAPNKEGVKSIGSVQVKEAITIPAGSYINLYENDKRKSDASPIFNLSVTEGKLKSQSGN